MNELPTIHLDGLIIAVATFIIIGVFHPIVIKAEYYWGTKCWPLFACFGLLTLVIAMCMEDTVISAILAVLACNAGLVHKRQIEIIQVLNLRIYPQAIV